MDIEIDIEIMIHGVPDGQDYFGIPEEHANMELFYDKSNETVKFVIETKKQRKTAYTYYSYLRYNGIIGAGDRSGSYFGLTMRMDKYYTDATYIYNLLEIIFNRYIVEVLLMPSGNAYKYSVRNFTNKSKELGQIQSDLIDLFRNTCIPSKIINIDDSLINPIRETPTGNISEFGEAAILASIQKYSKVVLSPDYETTTEMEYKKKLREAEGKGGSLVAQKEAEITKLKGDIKDLNDTVSSKNAEITTLKQEVASKDKEITKLEKLGDLKKTVAEIKAPITTLADYFHVQDSENKQEETKPKPKDKNFLLGAACCILTIIAIFLCLIILMRLPGKSTVIVPGHDSTEVAQSGEQTESSDLLTTDTSTEYPSEEGEDVTGTNKTPAELIDLRIDVAGYRSGKLKTNQTYTLTLKDGNQKYSGAGKWKVTNATVRGELTDATIKIQPNGKGNVTLSYTPNDIYCTCQSRTFEVESNPAPAVTIVIDPKVTEVEIDKEYTFSVPGYNNGEGTWGVDGFAKPTDNTSKSITVKAIDNKKDEATISYTPKDGVKVKQHYKYKK